MQMGAVWDDVRKDILSLLAEKACGPVLVRLSWHDAGTYCHKSGTGGPHACMRFAGGEAAHEANNGLDIARALLQPIKDKYPDVSYADFWAFAAVVAIEHLGGPTVAFRPGRVDAASVEASVPDGRLPDAKQGAAHLRDVFYRIGFNDREIVALSGAHSLGVCHIDRSGFEGPWTTNPQKFDNEYFVDLLELKWKKKVNAAGNEQFEDESGKGLMMLHTDLALLEDPEFRKVVEEYAKSQESFFADFATAFQKLQEAGVKY